MFFQIFCTLISSMTIIDSKNLYFWPLFFWHFRFFFLGLNNIQNNGNSVFICFSDQTYMSISCKWFYNTEFLIRSLRILKHWQSWACSNLHIILHWFVEFDSWSVIIVWWAWRWFDICLITGWCLTCVMVWWHLWITFSSHMWFWIWNRSSSLLNWMHIASLRLIDCLIRRLLNHWLLTHWFLITALSWIYSLLIVWV